MPTLRLHIVGPGPRGIEDAHGGAMAARWPDRRLPGDPPIRRRSDALPGRPRRRLRLPFRGAVLLR